MSDTVIIYLQLLGSALISVAVSSAFYLLEKATPFKRLPYAARQIIIGIAFGSVAVLGTELGIDVGGATANARDAAPLCAGLLFGAPAGIIAGILGGVERWFAVYWGAGTFSRIACSISTILAGLYAAVLRKHMMDDKRPTWGFGLACGVVMEVIHLTTLFLTNLDEAEKAFQVVEICTFPMILCNAVSIALSIIAISILSQENRRGTKQLKKISQQVQVWLLVCVIFAYFVTTIFVFRLQTGIDEKDAIEKLSVAVSDVQKDIQDTSDANLLSVTRRIAAEIESGSQLELTQLAKMYGVTELYIVNADGIVTDSNYTDTIGYDMRSGSQSADFLVLLNPMSGIREYVQEYQPLSYNPEVSRKFAGVCLSSGGFIQAAFDHDDFENDIASSIYDIARNRHIGNDGYIMILDSNNSIVSRRYDKANSVVALSLSTLIGDHQADSTYSTTVFGENCYCYYSESEGYYVIGVIPTEEVFENRNISAYVNSYMEVLVFAILFALIYFLIKRLVVNNIRTVNEKLGQIIGGNLNVIVDVKSSDEFASLSEDINSTVTTLKHYIDEAASRIDAELQFAKSIQHSALPSVFPAYPNIPQFDLFATMNTAKEVGGDFYDFYMLNDNTLAFLIADVSGKGIPAAMFMMTAKTMLKNLTESGLPLDEVMIKANEKLCEGNNAGMFVTAWMGLLDLTTGHVQFVNAGHNPPLIYRKGKGYDYLKSKAGFVLAGMEGFRYKVQEMDLAPGDRLYLYTDGVTEATDTNSCLYGEDRLKNYLNHHYENSVTEMLYGIKRDIDEFAAGAEQFDDITMLSVEYRGN